MHVLKAACQPEALFESSRRVDQGWARRRGPLIACRRAPPGTGPHRVTPSWLHGLP